MLMIFFDFSLIIIVLLDVYPALITCGFKWKQITPLVLHIYPLLFGFVKDFIPVIIGEFHGKSNDSKSPHYSSPLVSSLVIRKKTKLGIE